MKITKATYSPRPCKYARFKMTIKLSCHPMTVTHSGVAKGGKWGHAS